MLRRFFPFWLSLALVVALPAAAAPFCATTPAGPECRYQSFSACLKAVGKSGNCVTNQAELKKPVGKERYCVVTANANQCFYADVDACRHAASASGGSCTIRSY